MIKSIEYIDREFKPEIPPHLAPNFMEYAKRIKLPAYATPAPTLDGNKAAIWVGERIDHNGESPVLAVVAGRSEEYINERSRWFVGDVSLKLICEEAKHIDSIAPREAALLDKAQYGGFYEVNYAAHLLMGMYRA